MASRIKTNEEASVVAKMLGMQIRAMETGGRPIRPAISSGCEAMDRCLPSSGYACGSSVEFLTEQGRPNGATTLALQIAKQACRDGRYLVLIDPNMQYYPPAMEKLGIPLERTIALRPSNHADLVWAIDQTLRNPAVGCTLASLERMDDRTSRRMQLAAEAGGGLGIFLRSLESARIHPSWSEVQWFVSSSEGMYTKQALPFYNLQTPLQSVDAPSSSPWTPGATSTETRWFDLVLRRGQGVRIGTSLRLGIDASGNWVEPTCQEVRHAKTGYVHLAAQLAKPARVRREIAG